MGCRPILALQQSCRLLVSFCACHVAILQLPAPKDVFGALLLLAIKTDDYDYEYDCPLWGLLLMHALASLQGKQSLS